MVVTTLFEDDDDTIWIGLRTNILLIWDKKHGVIKSISEFPELNHIPTKANAVMSILKDREKGMMWLATRYNGLYYSRIVDGKYTELKHLSSLVRTPEHINALVQDIDGKIWIGSDDGLFQLEQRGDSEFIVNEVKEVNELIKGGSTVASLLLDDNGLWVGCK